MPDQLAGGLCAEAEALGVGELLERRAVVHWSKLEEGEVVVIDEQQQQRPGSAGLELSTTRLFRMSGVAPAESFSPMDGQEPPSQWRPAPHVRHRPQPAGAVVVGDSRRCNGGQRDQDGLLC